MAARGATENRIELRLKRLDQLFDSYDPAPFHEKDLDPDAEEYIVSWAREYPHRSSLLFVLHLPEDQHALAPEQTVRDAIEHYFEYRAGLAKLELRRLLQQGRASLLLGLTFLAVCTTARAVLQELAGPGDERDWLQVVQEGLLIVGWVAMWRPLELLLYDWWPVLRRRQTYQCLSRMAVEVQYDETPQDTTKRVPG